MELNAEEQINEQKIEQLTTLTPEDTTFLTKYIQIKNIEFIKKIMKQYKKCKNTFSKYQKPKYPPPSKDFKFADTILFDNKNYTLDT